MDDLGQPSQGFTSSVQLRHPSTVNYESADEMNASRYQVLWSNIMDKGNYTKPSGYHKVAVLLLCWDQDCVDLATQEEVDKLKAVFEDKFGYDATIAKLSPANGRLQVQVNQKVANFVSDHDGQNNLLIVYYAGHGKPGKNFGDLELFGFVLQIENSIVRTNCFSPTVKPLRMIPGTAESVNQTELYGTRLRIF